MVLELESLLIIPNLGRELSRQLYLVESLENLEFSARGQIRLAFAIFEVPA
jgi:hypothetical protein